MQNETKREEVYEFADIQRLLSGDHLADRKVFLLYANGKMKLETCLAHFKKNNNIDVEIRLDHFRDWLWSLGYWG